MSRGYRRGNQILTGKSVTPNTKKVKEIQLGTISATHNAALFSANRSMLIEAVEIVVTTTVAANDTNYWTFQLTNKESGSGSDVILAATNAETTKATGGSALTAFTKRSFDLTGTTANLTLAQDDTVIITATKAASGANLVEAYVRITYTEA